MGTELWKKGLVFGLVLILVITIAPNSCSAEGSDTINFSVENVLQSNNVKSVFIYDITKDSTDYTTWYNNPTKPWTELHNTIVDSALTLDGDGDRVTLIAPEGLTFWNRPDTHVTVEAWVYPKVLSGSAYINQIDIIAGGYDLLWYDGEYKPTFYIGDLTTPDIKTTTAIVENKWYHIVGTYDGSTLSIYVNGQLNNSVASTGNIQDNPTEVNLGSDYSGIYPLNGYIDEFRIYNRTLSPEEINNAYQRGLQHLPSNNSNDSLMVYFPFENDLNDVSGNQVTGTAVGDARITGKSFRSWWTEANETIVDSSLYCDGTGDRVSFGYNPTWNSWDATSDFSIETWYRPDGVQPSWAIVFMGWQESGSTYVAFEISPDKTLRTYLRDTNSNVDQAFSANSVEDNKWHYAAFSYNSSASLLTYKFDNEAIQTHATYYTGNFMLDSDREWALCDNGPAPLPFKGWIDEFKVYDRTITETEMNQSYENGLQHVKSQTNNAGILGNYTFDITATTDYSGQGNNGTLYGDARITGRSSKNEFPLKSYLVATDLGLDIIDAETTDLWMRFESGVNNAISASDFTAVQALDGCIFIGSDTGLYTINFIDDTIQRTDVNGVALYSGNISERNNGKGYGSPSGSGTVDTVINDVALTTGYAFVGTNSGVSLINLETGSIADDPGSACYSVFMKDEALLYHDYDELLRKNSYPSVDFEADDSTYFNGVNDIVANEETIFAGVKNGGMVTVDSATFSLSKQIVKSSFNDAPPHFWNTMQHNEGSILTSEIGTNLGLAGTSWHFASAMFGNGWDNDDENSYAYANSNDIIPNRQQGALEFYWVPDDDGNAIVSGGLSTLFSNGATNNPVNDRWYFEFRYHHQSPPAFQLTFTKRDQYGVTHGIQNTNIYTGTWKAGERVHIVLAWQNEPVLLGEYIVVLVVNGEVVKGWTQPDEGTLEGWRITNPVQPYSPTMRIGDSIFSYSYNEQLRGPMDNCKIYSYAKDDWGDRHLEDGAVEKIFAGATGNVQALAIEDDGTTVYIGTNDGRDGGGVSKIDSESMELLDEWTLGVNEPLIDYDITSLSFWQDPEDADNRYILAGTENGATLLFTGIPNAPPLADAGGPYHSYKDRAILFDASGSTDPEGDELQYRWDLDNDGTWDTSYSTDPTTTYVWHETYSGIVAVEVFDGRVSDSDTTSVTVQNVTIVSLVDSNGAPLSGGVVQYYSSGWQSFGVTNETGQVSKEIPCGNYRFRMTYEFASVEKYQDVGVNPVVVFQTVHAVVELRDSQGQLIDQGSVMYYSGGWHTLGLTVGGLVEKELLSNNYRFRMTYEFASVEKYQDVGVNPVVVFQTVHAVVELRDSQGQLIDQGSVMYYSGGWHTVGFTTGGRVEKELLPNNYRFRMTYEYASVEKYQDIGINPIVTFQTVNTVVELRDSQSQLIDQGSVMYYSGGWRNLGLTVGGQVEKELLPNNYRFRMTYEFASVEKYQDVGVNPVVVFQTVHTVVELRDSQGQLIDQGSVMYYSGGWRNLGLTVGGQVEKELLPNNYRFRMTYEFASVEKYQDVGVNPVVVFQTVHTVVELRDSQGQLIDQGSVMYYSGGWRNLGLTVGGQVEKELLPNNYRFRMTYKFASVEKYQDIGINPLVQFQTGKVISDSGTCTNYYSGGWRTFTNGMELLPTTYRFRFNDGTGETYYTIIAGTTNHIH